MKNRSDTQKAIQSRVPDGGDKFTLSQFKLRRIDAPLVVKPEFIFFSSKLISGFRRIKAALEYWHSDWSRQVFIWVCMRMLSYGHCSSLFLIGLRAGWDTRATRQPSTPTWIAITQKMSITTIIWRVMILQVQLNWHKGLYPLMAKSISFAFLIGRFTAFFSCGDLLWLNGQLGLCRAAKAFRRAYDFNQENTVVMDFACGIGASTPDQPTWSSSSLFFPVLLAWGSIGLVSQELIPYAKSIVGVDISQRMVHEYNRRVANQGISMEEMHALRADILGSGSDQLESMLGSFDVITVSTSLLALILLFIGLIVYCLLPPFQRYQFDDTSTQQISKTRWYSSRLRPPQGWQSYYWWSFCRTWYLRHCCSQRRICATSGWRSLPCCWTTVLRFWWCYQREEEWVPGYVVRCSWCQTTYYILISSFIKMVRAMQFACRITCSARRSHVYHWSWKLGSIENDNYWTTSIPPKLIMYFIRQHLYHLNMFHLWKAMLWRYLKLTNSCEWKNRKATGQTGLSWVIRL